MTVNITVASDDIEKSDILSQAIAEFLVGKGCLNVVDVGSNIDYSIDTADGSIRARMIEEAHAQREGAPYTLLDMLKKNQPGFDDFLTDETFRVKAEVISDLDKDIAKAAELKQEIGWVRGAAHRYLDDVESRLNRLREIAKGDGLANIQVSTF